MADEKKKQDEFESIMDECFRELADLFRWLDWQLRMMEKIYLEDLERSA